VNGPKGGVDQRCQVMVTGPRVGRLAVQELGQNPYAAVSSAVERIARATGRKLGRARTSRGRRDHSPGNVALDERPVARWQHGTGRKGAMNRCGP